MKKVRIGLEVSFPEGDSDHWHLVSAHSLILHQRGRATVSLMNEERLVQGCAVCWMPAGTRYRVRLDKPHAKRLQMIRIRNRAFAPSQSVDRMAHSTIMAISDVARAHHGVLPLTESARGEIRERVAQCFDRKDHPMLLKASVFELLHELSTHLPVASETQSLLTGAARIRRVIDHIHQNTSEPLTVAHAVAISGLSRSAFHDKFRQSTNMTFKQYLRQIRIDEAARMLRYTDREILDVAYACGFQSISAFYQAFKCEMGVSPNEHRRG